MDEPFTFIDDISAKEILGSMFEFVGEDRTIIYITISAQFLDMFDTIYYFDKGRIVESGSWDELMKSKNRLYKDIIKKE